MSRVTFEPFQPGVEEYPDDPFGGVCEDPKRTLQVELTEEQARLYATSATFRQGVDALLRGVVPNFLDGLAAKAEAVDRDMEARMREAMGAWASFRD